MSPPGRGLFLDRHAALRLHVLLIEPTNGACHGSVVVAQALGAEMNFSRRHVVRASRHLASQGWTVMIPDLRGTGDSTGLAEATTWSDWADDLLACCDWMGDRTANRPLWICGHRGGALSAALAWSRLANAHLMLWEPIASLMDLRRQWERQAAAAATSAGGDARLALKSLAATWSDGRCAHVAGTPVPAQLAYDPGVPDLSLLPPKPGSRLVWLERLGRSLAQPSDRAKQRLASWRAAGGTGTIHTVDAPAFWLNAETAPDEAWGTAAAGAISELM